MGCWRLLLEERWLKDEGLPVPQRQREQQYQEEARLRSPVERHKVSDRMTRYLVWLVRSWGRRRGLRFLPLPLPRLYGERRLQRLTLLALHQYRRLLEVLARRLQKEEPIRA